MPTGRLTIDHNTNISSLQENIGTRRLARQGPGNVFSNATNFLENERNLHHGDFITVTSGPGTTATVIFVVDAAAASPVPETLGASKTAAKKSGKTSKTAAKKSGKAAKKAAKKSAKKTTVKRAGKKSPKKSGTKKSSKKSSHK